MFKEKFKATLINKDAATDVMYHTSQVMKLENDNCIILISDNEKMTQKADLAEHQSIRSVIFQVKIIFKINEVIKSIIDAFNSLNESLYVTCKIMTKILMNWIFSIRFNIKLHQVTSSLFESCLSVHDILHNWVFRLHSNSDIRDVIIMNYLNMSLSHTFYFKFMFFIHNIDDSKIKNLRQDEWMILLEFIFRSISTHTQSILPKNYESSSVFQNIENTFKEVFDLSEDCTVKLKIFISMIEQDTFLNQYRKFNSSIRIKWDFSAFNMWFSQSKNHKHIIQVEQVTSKKNRSTIYLSYQCTYRDDKKCWLIEDFFRLQSMKTQRALIAKTQTLLCELRALITFAKTDKKYVDLLRLFNCFDYQFDSKNHFEMQINDDKWTTIILVKSFIFFNTTNVSIALHHFLIKTDWSSTELKSTFDLREREWQNDDKQVLQYCLFDTSNVISVRSIISDKLDRIKIATIRILNSAHIDERNYEYNDRFRDIILSQNLRIKFTPVLFEDLNLSTTLAEWNIELNKFQMLIMQYFQNLFNDFDLIKRLFEIEKTLMNIIITMLLLKLSKKVKVLNSFNNTADTFILKLNEQLQWLKNKDIILTDKKIIRFHLQFTERQIVAQDSCASHSVNNNFAWRRWNVFHELSDVFYDQLTHWIIDQSKKTLHDIKNHQYKLHQISLDTLLLKVTSLSNHSMNKTQSQS